jgi:hypothetical protein
MNRREFIKESGLGWLALALAGSTLPEALAEKSAGKRIKWSLKPKKWKSLGPLDLVSQLEQGQRLMNQSLIKYGAFPASGRLCMREVCMTAEASAYYYALTGDAESLEAVKAAVTAFRKYRHKARGHRIPYEGIDEPGKADLLAKGDNAPTIHYEMISCHVGRNMRGMWAAAHILQDEQLLHEAAEELNWWIDNPLGFNPKEHFFDARIFVDDKGRNLGSEKKYTMNMGGSLACAMWLVGNSLQDQRLMEYADDQIINGIAPHQFPNGYFPYDTRHKQVVEFVDGIALDTNHYHGLTLQVMSPLLAYKQWRNKPKFVELIRRGIAAIRRKKFNFCPKPPYGSTVNSALVHTRLHKYLAEPEALEQAAKNLRWLHWNSPTCIPFCPGFPYHGVFRETVLMAWEGIHLRQKGIRDVEVMFIE